MNQRRTSIALLCLLLAASEVRAGEEVPLVGRLTSAALGEVRDYRTVAPRLRRHDCPSA